MRGVGLGKWGERMGSGERVRVEWEWGLGEVGEREWEVGERVRV